MQLLKTKSRYLLFILIPAFLFLFGYWLKCQEGTNFFDSFSIGSYFPFYHLRNETILSPPKGIIFYEDFDKINIFSKWSDSLKSYTSATSELSKDGFNNTQCLLIRNSDDRRWVHSHKKKIETKIGDIFYYEGLVNIKGHRLHTYFSVSTFDEDKNIINWNVFKGDVNRIGSWVKVKKKFTISNNKIKFITFRLDGFGRGEFRFDNITFRKVN